MKSVFALAAMCLVLSAFTPQQPREDSGLPELHRIRTATLSPSYSCRSEEEFQKGYENTALFLSKYSLRRNSPELLFNGACKTWDYLQGHGLDVIADLGDVPIEELRPTMFSTLSASMSARTIPGSAASRIRWSGIPMPS